MIDAFGPSATTSASPVERTKMDGADSVLPSGAICVLVHEDPGVAK